MAYIQGSVDPKALLTMAASLQGSVEWSTTVKPILTALYGQFYDQNDAAEIIQAILRRFVYLLFDNFISSADSKIFILLSICNEICFFSPLLALTSKHISPLI